MMDPKNKNRKDDCPDDKVIFIPDEEYHSLIQSLCKLEQVQQELHKIRDNLNNG